jgi:hypothetical protein
MRIRHLYEQTDYGKKPYATLVQNGTQVCSAVCLPTEQVEKKEGIRVASSRVARNSDCVLPQIPEVLPYTEWRVVTDIDNESTGYMVDFVHDHACRMIMEELGLYPYPDGADVKPLTEEDYELAS